ncbi:exodeoxyribonuclease V subunit beta [Halochromatium roseum]|uniref:exodeoxyribonuclease V subunit beta n=1 Tax=Halochromatium roseum TaxID=391920 RepID=UPI003B830590|nr:exodeoxyribonuclease V subunit beta [Halochromatium roseum]
MPAATTTLDPLHFPLWGSRLIEASAGTGKTFTLALLYIRLVLGHGRTGEAATAFARPLTPPEILVVTFTDAATKELRERIRARLVEAAELFSQPVPTQTQTQTHTQTAEPDPVITAASESAGSTAPAPATQAASPNDPLQALRQDYPAEHWPACAHRLRLAAEWMDEAMIATIHGWCQRMLHEHAFATGGLFERILVTDQSELIAETLRDYWRKHCYGRPLAEARCIREVATSPEVLQGKLREWLQRRDAQLCFKGQPLDGDCLQTALATRIGQREAEDEARRIWREDREAIEKQLRALRSNLDGRVHGSANPAGFDQVLAKIGAWSEGADAPTQLPHFARGAFAFKKKAPVQTAPEHPVYDALASWQQTLQAADASKPNAPPSLEACLLAHAAHWLAEELPRRLRIRAEMGFDELLSELDAALTPADDSPSAQTQAAALAATIRRQFPVALIDEFQDTDPIQYRIFDAIYQVAANDPNTALVMIGDPKQSIYAFRGADIHAYLAARQATTGRHATLATNFRSTEAMVDACNRFFGHAEAQPRAAFRFAADRAAAPNADADAVPEAKPAAGPATKVATQPAPENPIPYVTITANGRDQTLLIDGAPATALTCWTLEPPEGTAATAPDDYLQRMATATAAEIARWLAQATAPEPRTGFAPTGSGQVTQPLKPSDIAILVSKGKEAAVMRQALAALRINSVYLSDRDSVFQTQEAADLLHWLKACAAPTDEGLVRAALGTNTLAIPLEELARLQEDELDWETQVMRFLGYQRTWQRQGVLAMLRRLLHEQHLPARLLQRANGERVLTNLLHLAEWLQQSATALDGEQALIRHLSTHLDLGGEEFIVRLESDAELVQVITIHKSKGLEYPLVLLPFICSWRKIDGHSRQVPTRLAAGEAGGAAGSRALEVAGNKAFQAAWDNADDERLSEDMRKLYVALTRARHAAWLGITPLSRKSKEPKLHESAIGHVLKGGRPFTNAAEVWDALAQLKGDGDDIAIQALPTTPAQPLATATDTLLEPARSPSHGRFEPWWIASYSALTVGAAQVAAEFDGPGSEPSAGDTAEQETALEESSLETGLTSAMTGILSSALTSEPAGPGTGESDAAGDAEGQAQTEGEVNSGQSGDQASGQPSDQSNDQPSDPANKRLDHHPVVASRPSGSDNSNGECSPGQARATSRDNQATPGSLHALPRGSRYGTFLHGLLEWAARLPLTQDPQDPQGQPRRGFAAAAHVPALRQDLLARRCQLRGLTDWIGPLDQWLEHLLTTPWTLSGLAPPQGPAPTLRLEDLAPSQVQVELEFWITSDGVKTATLDRLVQAHCLPGAARPQLRPNQLDGLLKGFIDLVFEHQGRYYLLDWKSNWLGPDDSAYTDEAMRTAILAHRYDLQYALYLLALHRLLRARLPNYQIEQHLGGALYVFLRGYQAPTQGLFMAKPSRALIRGLDRLFNGRPLTTQLEVA